MTRRRTQKQPPRYHNQDGDLRPLSPIERTILEAFRQPDQDEKLQDEITLASWLCGGYAFPAARFHAAEKLAKLVTRDLVAMGYLTSDDRGWLRLTDPQPNQEPPK